MMMMNINNPFALARILYNVHLLYQSIYLSYIIFYISPGQFNIQCIDVKFIFFKLQNQFFTLEMLNGLEKSTVKDSKFWTIKS